MRCINITRLMMSSRMAVMDGHDTAALCASHTKSGVEVSRARLKHLQRLGILSCGVANRCTTNRETERPTVTYSVTDQECSIGPMPQRRGIPRKKQAQRSDRSTTNDDVSYPILDFVINMPAPKHIKPNWCV